MLQTPLLYAVLHLLLAALLQAENYVVYVSAASDRRAALRRVPFLLPRIQTDNVLVSVVIGLLACCAQNVMTRWLFLAGYVALLVYMVIDQLYYKRFFDHFRPSAVTSAEYLNVRWLVSSVSAELDRVFPANLGLLAVAAIAVGTGVTPALDAHVGTLAAGAAALAVFGLPAAFSTRLHHLQRHPLGVLAHDLIRRWFVGTAIPRVAFEPVEPGLLPSPEGAPSIELQTAAAANRIRERTRRPNVILVVLESVGGWQLFGTGTRLSPEVTPNLAQWSEQALLFPYMYSHYPGSVRTYVPLETGGLHATAEQEWISCMKGYRGPTLPRAFAASSYRTGLFSSACLSAESMDELVALMGYDHVCDIAANRDHFGQRNMIHWWGSREEHTIHRMNSWIGQDAKTPFFLLYWTCATHHPYGAPPDYPCPFDGDDLPTRYRNAIHYTDACLKKLVDSLKAQGLWENTILAITGDHGEAFGMHHPTNFYHSGFLFEENIRTFLMLISPALTGGPIVSERLIQCGDVLPTLAHLANLATPGVCGKNVCAPVAAPRFAHFFTLHGTERWGLRDGNWKFTQEMRSGRAELYDLEQDPTETANLATAYPERVQGYSLCCRDWFLRTDVHFASQVRPFLSSSIEPPRVLRSAG